MHDHVEIEPAAQSVVAALGCFQLPIELDHVRAFGRDRSRADGLCFRFGFREIPFKCEAERQEGQLYLNLTGDLGALPYTAESANQRRSIQTILSAAGERSGLQWTVSPQQQIEVKGALTLDRPLTGSALVTGAVTLLLRAQPYLDLLIDTLCQPKPGA